MLEDRVSILVYTYFGYLLLWRSCAADGVELLQLPERGGKTRAENAAAEHLRCELAVNTGWWPADRGPG